MGTYLDILAAEADGILPADLTVNLTTDEFVIICRQLAAVPMHDRLRPHAKSAFTKLIQAAQASRSIA